MSENKTLPWTPSTFTFVECTVCHKTMQGLKTNKPQTCVDCEMKAQGGQKQ